MPSFLVSAARRKLLAGAHYDFLDPNFVRAALGCVAADGDGVAGLDDALRPTSSDQMIRTGEFPFPLLGRSRIVFGFPSNLDVRIHEFKSGHDALYGNRLGRIIVRVAVVRECHGCKGQEPYTRGNKTYSSIFHIVPHRFVNRRDISAESAHRSLGTIHQL